MKTQEGLRHQYERFPYPPIGALALPRSDQGLSLRFELGTSLTLGKLRSHRGIRILVAGAGTIEPLVVAQRHPEAREIVAADFSQKSLNILRRRVQFARLARFTKKLSPLTITSCDLLDSAHSLGTFDYIVASNLIHHFASPKQILECLSQLLHPDGLMRVVTYPKASRIWMRQTSQWLRHQGLGIHTPHLVKSARRLIQTLPKDDPRRLTFEIHPETQTSAGLIDAFFNALENPLRPMELAQHAKSAGLMCLGESQTASSRSEFLCEIIPKLTQLGRWERLQVLDDLLELCANPVLWFAKQPSQNTLDEFSESQAENLESKKIIELDIANTENLAHKISPHLPHDVRIELTENLARVSSLIRGTGVTLSTLIEAFSTQVGPRVHPKDPNLILKGLALWDHVC